MERSGGELAASLAWDGLLMGGSDIQQKTQTLRSRPGADLEFLPDFFLCQRVIPAKKYAVDLCHGLGHSK